MDIFLTISDFQAPLLHGSYCILLDQLLREVGGFMWCSLGITDMTLSVCAAEWETDLL